MNIALYLRFTKDDKKRDTANQLHKLREFAASSGWIIVYEYVDRASGKSGDRAQLQVMFADASERKFDLVLFWALDRFSREGVSATLKYLERLQEAGVDWRSYQEPYFDRLRPV